jgi:hypothetical protein
MSRLHAEWRRLFAVDPIPHARPGPLFDADGARTRTLVMEWGRPADWPTLRTLWQAVQVEFDWPAPLIAIDGRHAFQLWISLAEPVPASAACEAAAALARRWLPQAPAAVAAARLAVWPRPESQAGGVWQHAAPVPALHAGPQPRWSAFVTPDLAAVFGDDPALDIDPGDEAQAEVAARCGSVSALAWARARDALRLNAAASQRVADGAPGPAAGAADGPADTSGPTAVVATAGPDLGGPHDDPAAFLKAVMNHPAVPLALRIEAARALL